MRDYYDELTGLFNCRKAYSYFISQIGTTKISEMTQEEYLKFEVLSYLKRHDVFLKIEDAINKKDYYLMINHHLSKDDAQKINLLEL